jgi:integrase
MKVSTSAYFDEGRQRWRVRFRAADLDRRLNVPLEDFEKENVSPTSTSKRAENIALEWAATMRSQLFAAKAVGAMSLRQIFDLMKSINPDAVTAATWARNDIHIRNLERLPEQEPLGLAIPDQIDGRLAAMYRNERLKEDAAPRTVAGELTFLIRLLRFGYEEASSATGMTAMRLTKLPKIAIKEESMVALTVEQFFEVLEATKKMRQRRDVTRRRLIFGVTSLLRKTPLMGLRAEWIHLDDSWLEVPASAQKGRSGEKRPLSVPLAGWAVEQLPHPLPTSGCIWANHRSGQPTGNVTHTLNKLADVAGVPRFSLHDLRATGNTWLANAGVDERLRQYLMGHNAGGPTISRYTKITSDSITLLRAAVAIFDEIREANENVRSIRVRRRSG